VAETGQDPNPHGFGNNPQDLASASRSLKTAVAAQLEAGGQHAKRWVYTVGEVPRNAVQGGYDTSGVPLYHCRGLISGTWQPGKIRDGFGACNAPYGGREVAASRYQVLVKLTPSVQLVTATASNGGRPHPARSEASLPSGLSSRQSLPA
jgi:Protein of unknown function (DUF3421)